MDFFAIPAPNKDFANKERGDCLLAMECHLSMCKRTYEKLRELHETAGKSDDFQLEDFSETLMGDRVRPPVASAC